MRTDNYSIPVKLLFLMRRNGQKRMPDASGHMAAAPNTFTVAVFLNICYT